ncbi:MAG: FtsQ-type POTRA domain-containing protein, partial [Cyanobacteria bacterium P01_F01_bin.42]
MVAEDSEDIKVEQVLLDPILDRRNLLKRQRRNRFLESVWRTGFICALSVSLGWGLSRPEWKVHGPEQVRILGNTQLSDQALFQLMPIAYPTSLIRVQPQKIARRLTDYAHVEQVSVSRQLFPPQVTVVIQERSPVAKARCIDCVLVHPGQTPFPKSDWWLIDKAGVVLPWDSYPELKQSRSLPDLEIEGYLQPHPSEQSKSVTIDPKQQQRIKALLPSLMMSPVAIKHLDLRETENLKLKTALGLVH